MGGKSSTSTSSVQIPPEVLARYNAVNARAETAAANPFQNYGGQFVAGLTGEQQAGINQASQSAQAAQPYYGAATGMTLSGAQDVGALTPGQINQYQNPYTQAVVAPTLQALQQQQGQQLSDQQTQAIKGGAAFGERSNLARNDLMRKQNLGTAEAIAPLYQQGYQQATQTAMGQQGVVAADMARRLQAAQQLAGLGTGAQQAGIQGAQALLAAGTVGQQTQQADLTAKYQEFLQQQGYPFQTAQFLANIAMGTGALSGSTTSTTQPAPFFSDERLKHDAKKIGETNDGLPIYSFKYNGDDRTQIGLMAQDVEKKKPEAVGLAPASDGHMYKTVDYEKATRAKKYAGGGLAPMDNSMGGAVGPMSLGEAFARGGYAYGGPSILGSADHKALMAANVDPEAGPYAEHGIYKTPRNVIPGLGGSKINMGKGAPPPSLVTPSPIGGNTANQIGLGAQALSGLQMVNTGKEAFNSGKTALLGSAPTQADPEGARGLIGGQGKMSGTNIFQSLMGGDDEKAGGGLVVPRSGYDIGGGIDDTKTEDQGDDSGVVIPGMKGGIPLGAGMKAAKLAVASSPSGGGQRGPGNDMLDALKLGKGVMDLGSGLGSLATMFAANGGAIERKGYQTAGRIEDTGIAGTGLGTLGDGDVVADGGSDAPPVDRGIVVPKSLIASESGGDWGAQNDVRGSGGLNGHFGRLQFGQARLQDAINAGVLPQGTTPEQFRTSKDLQKSAEQWHFGDIVNHINDTGLDKAIGTKINGIPVTQEGMLNVAHLGGKGGLSKFIASGGEYDPADANGTRLSDYLAMGSGAGSQRERGLTFGRSGPGMYSGKEASQASLGDVVGEFLPKSVPGGSNFWVPALSGLGSMLSSKSHTLAGAVGEGLVGGVSGYQAQQKQEQATVKNIFDMVKDRFTQTMEDGKLVFRDNMTGNMLQPGQVQAAVSRMLTSAGIDPAPYGLDRMQTAGPAQVGTETRQGVNAGAAKTVVGTTEAQPGAAKDIKTEVQSIPDKPREEWGAGELRKDFFDHPVDYGFPAQGKDSPKARLIEIQRLQKQAEDATRLGLETQAARYNTQALEKEKILEQQIKDATSFQAAKNTKMQELMLGDANKYATEGGKLINDYDHQKNLLMDVSRMQGLGMQTGTGADVKAKVASILKNSFGLDDATLKRFNLNDPTQINYLSKIAAESVTDRIAARNLGRAPASMGQMLQKSSPDPSIDSHAVHMLIGNALGDLEHQVAKDKEYINKYKGKDPNAFIAAYADDPRNKDSYKKAMGKAYSELYVPSDNPTRTRELISELKDKYGEYYTPRILSEELKAKKATPSGGETKVEAPAAPPIPTALQNVEGLQYSASRNQYRDKAGNVYDASGKRVQ